MEPFLFSSQDRFPISTKNKRRTSVSHVRLKSGAARFADGHRCRLRQGTIVLPEAPQMLSLPAGQLEDARVDSDVSIRLA
jgi:hypothetical protein